jgi:elongation factor Ts
LEATGDATLLKDICMHIAALNPSALTRDTLDPEEIAREREILKAAALKEGKPEAIVDKMVEGRLRNFYAERVLTEQEFVKSQDKKTVGEFAKDHGITLKRYAHWILGG